MSKLQTSSLGASPEALGQSEAFLDFQEKLSRVAPVNRPVLLVGERGTGKELAAARLHYLSGRWQKPFVTLNCSALAPALIESELFGYERGAFTGAFQRRIGRFEAADSGTLFLDEIGNVPSEVQEKILRVVEYHSFERVGSSARVGVDVRIVAATHANLKELVASQKFRADLLDRLSFEVLIVPPLRERGGDILLLANHFARRMALELGRSAMPRFSAAASAELQSYSWPGNVRELENAIEHAFVICTSDQISLHDLPQEILNPDLQRSIRRQHGIQDPEDEYRKKMTREILLALLKDSEWNKAEVSRRTGLSRATIWKYMKKWKIPLQ